MAGAGLVAPDVLRLELVIALCATLVIGPISWTHYYCMLLIPMALYLGGRLPVPDSPLWMSWLGVGTLLVSAPVRVPNASQALIGPVISRVFVSYYFYGALIFLAVFLAARLAIPPDSPEAALARDPLPAEI